VGPAVTCYADQETSRSFMDLEDLFAHKSAIRFCFDTDESSPESRSLLCNRRVIALFRLISDRDIIIIIFNRRIFVENQQK
jgi:hypothetical protein